MGSTCCILLTELRTYSTSVDVNVRSGGDVCVTMDIPKGRVGGWEWYLQASDIYHEASFIGKSGKKVQIIPHTYYDKAYVKMLKFSYKAEEEDGALNLKWSNQGWTSRDLCYRTFLVEENTSPKDVVTASDIDVTA